MRRRLIAGLVAAVMAVVGSVLVLNYVNGADARAVEGRTPTTVYVTQKLIPTGTTLAAAVSGDLMKATKVPADARPVGALDHVGPDNTSQIALSDIAPGQYVQAAAFGTSPLAVKAINVPDGKLAMSVQLSDPARVGQFVTPGTHLTIYATYAMKWTGTDEKSKALNQLNLKGTTVLLPDVEVIAMGQTALSAPAEAKNGADKTGSSSATSGAAKDAAFLVTLAVDPKDASRLAHAVNGYTLYAGLRGSNVQVGQSDTSNDFTEFGKTTLDQPVK